MPFCTSRSSGIGSSASNLHVLCPDSVKWEAGKRFGAGTSKEEIQEWLTETSIRIPDVSGCNHDYTSRVTEEPDCTTAGKTTYICTNCGESYTEIIPATGHRTVTDPAIPAGCETQGKTEGSHCEICGK